MTLKSTIHNTFASKFGRSATLALAILLATSACTTEDDSVSTIDAAATDEAASEGATSEEAPADESTSDAADFDSADEVPPENPADYASLTCLTNGTDLALLNLFADDMAPFNGVVVRGNSVLAVSGDYANDSRSQPISLNVSTTAVGAAEEGGDSVTYERWVIDGEGSYLNLDGTSLEATPCIGVDPDRIDELQQFIGDNFPPMPTPTTDMGTVRTCYIQGDDVLVIDTDIATSSFTGARTYLDSVEALAGRLTDETIQDRVVVDVNVSPIGSGEEEGGPIVNQEQWDLSYLRAELFVPNPNRMFAQVADCDALGEQVAQLDRLVGAYPNFP